MIKKEKRRYFGGNLTQLGSSVGAVPLQVDVGDGRLEGVAQLADQRRVQTLVQRHERGRPVAGTRHSFHQAPRDAVTQTFFMFKIRPITN